jgi:SsrA-binding protein
VEAGIALTGSEVKSARQGRVSLKEAYARVREGEVFLHGAHFGPYAHAGPQGHDPLRVKKLLLHAAEIRRLAKETEARGITLVPTRLYLRDGRVKLELAVAKGKRPHDKRESERRRDMEREIATARVSGRAGRPRFR